MPTRLRTVARFGLLLMFAILLLVAALSLSQQFPAGQDWTHYVRIGAYGLKTDNAEQIVRNAASHTGRFLARVLGGNGRSKREAA